MLRARQPVALLSLVLVGPLALGMEAGHSAAHLLEHGLGAERFDGGHATPVSHLHVEAAHAVVVETCAACALPNSAPALAGLPHAGPGTAASARQVPPAVERGFDQLGYSSLRGRAPPAA